MVPTFCEIWSHWTIRAHVQNYYNERRIEIVELNLLTYLGAKY